MPASHKKVRDDRKANFLNALKRSNNFAGACESIKAHRSTVWRWMQSDRQFFESVISIRESFVDLAESKLIELIKQDDFRAIKFMLQTMGRSRGYGEKIDIRHSVKNEFDTKKLEMILLEKNTWKMLEDLSEPAEENITDSDT